MPPARSASPPASVEVAGGWGPRKTGDDELAAGLGLVARYLGDVEHRPLATGADAHVAEHVVPALLARRRSFPTFAARLSSSRRRSAIARPGERFEWPARSGAQRRECTCHAIVCAMKPWLVTLLVAGCDAGEAIAPQRPVPVPTPVVGGDAAPIALLGSEPGTLGPAFDGLTLGQAIDQQAATAWLKQRGIEASAYVRDGHLASINLRVTSSMKQWPSSGGEDFEEHWFVPAAHQHATEVTTERGSFLQFDLEVPIERWIDTTVGSIVPLELVAKPMDDAEGRIHVPTHANYVDGHAHVSWVDSALAGAASATELSVREFHTYDHDRDVVQSHDLYVELDATPDVYDSIDHRLTALFGKPARTAKAVTWKRGKLTLARTATGSGIEHIELTAER
ncbi:MAG: hypothetical protein ABJE66_10255 [Deltaproteobacteria bacterium]